MLKDRLLSSSSNLFQLNDSLPDCSDPSDPEQVEMALRYALLYWLAKAEQYFMKNYSVPEIDLSLRGRCAGQAFLQTWRIRFNLQLLRDNYSDFMQHVVPHELAHLIAYEEFGGRIRPHGKEWRSIMEQVFGVPAKTTHQFDVSETARQNYLYRCGCPGKVHGLTIRRHNKIIRGTNYLCKSCRKTLLFDSFRNSK